MMLLALAMAAADGPSFDCAKATISAEKMICADEQLAHADQALAVLFHSALAHRVKFEPGDTQREWLESRNKCADEFCLFDAYEWRIAQLLGLTGLGRAYDSGPNQTLSVLPLGHGWYAFSATGIWIGSVELGQVNDAEASGVFKLVNDRGSRPPAFEYDCGWKIQRLPRNRWKLENWPGSKDTPCGGVNATVEGIYGP
jgi:hypothetical protein